MKLFVSVALIVILGVTPLVLADADPREDPTSPEPGETAGSSVTTGEIVWLDVPSGIIFRNAGGVWSPIGSLPSPCQTDPPSGSCLNRQQCIDDTANAYYWCKNGVWTTVGPATVSEAALPGDVLLADSDPTLTGDWTFNGDVTITCDPLTETCQGVLTDDTMADPGGGLTAIGSPDGIFSTWDGQAAAAVAVVVGTASATGGPMGWAADATSCTTVCTAMHLACQDAWTLRANPTDGACADTTGLRLCLCK